MAFVYADRVKESSTTVGTGTMTLAGPQLSFQSFAAVGDGNQCSYGITDGTDWETGIGTYTASGTTLSRDTVFDSSNGGALVSWPGSVKIVYVTPLATYATTAYRQTYAGVNLQTGLAYTLDIDDDGKMVERSNAAANTLVIPLNAAVVFPDFCRIDACQIGAGQTTVTHAGTLRGDPKIAGQYAAVSLYRRGADDWVVIGGVT